MPSLEEMLIQIEATTEGLRRELKKGDRELGFFEKNVSHKLKNVDKSFDSLGRTISTKMLQGVRSLTDFRTVLFTLTGSAGIGLLIQNSLAYADSIEKAAQRTGLATGEFQKFSFGAKIAGLDQEGFNAALAKFNVVVGQAINGNKAAGESLKKLGVDVEAVKSGQIGTGEAFLQAADGISKLGSSSEKAAISAQLFGRDAGPRLAGFLDEGRQGILSYAKQAENLGLVIDQDIIQKAAQAKDNIEILGQVTKVNFAAGFLDGFVGDFAQFSEMAKDPALAEGIRGLGELMGGLAKAALIVAAGVGDAYNILTKVQPSEKSRPVILPGGEIVNPNSGKIDDVGETFGPAKPDALRQAVITAQKKYKEQQEELNAALEKTKQTTAAATIETQKSTAATQNATQSGAAHTKVVDYATDAARRGAESYEALGREIHRTSGSYNDFNSSVRETGKISGQVFSDLINDVARYADSFDSLRSYALRTLADIAAGLLSIGSGGSASSGIGGAIANFIAGAFAPEKFGPPAPAAFHDYAGPVTGGKAYRVGTPELFVPSFSGMAYPLKDLASGKGGPTYYIDARGADRQGIAELQAGLTALGGRVEIMNKSIEPRAIAAVGDQKKRSISYLR